MDYDSPQDLQPVKSLRRSPEMYLSRILAPKLSLACLNRKMAEREKKQVQSAGNRRSREHAQARSSIGEQVC